MSIQRYAAYWVNGAFELNPREDGEYVRFDEHEREMARLRELYESALMRLSDANCKRSMLIDEVNELRSRIAIMRAR